MTIDVGSAAIRHRVGSDGLVVLSLRNEDLVIHGSTGDEVIVSAEDGGSLDGLEVDRGEGSIEVRGTDGRGRDLEVTIPTAVNLIVQGTSTDVRVDGLSGGQRYRLVSGDLEIRSSRGLIDAESMSGDVDVVADGPVRLAIRTVSGDVAIRAGSVLALGVGTTSGDIRMAVDLDGDGPFTLETVSGDVTLSVESDLRVETQTIAGDIRSEAPARIEDVDGQRSIVVGSGGPTVAFRSTSGDLLITRPAAHRSTVSTPPSANGPTSVRVVGPDDAMDVLRALERGDIDVAEAARRLEVLEGADVAAGTTVDPADPEEMPHA